MKTKDIYDGVDFAGAVAQRVGIVRVMFGVIVILGGLLIWQQYKFSDRFTGEMHRVYVEKHNAEREKIIAREKQPLLDMVDDVAAIRVDMAELKANNRVIMNQLKLNGSH